MVRKPCFQWLLVTLFVLLVSGCGGGGSGLSRVQFAFVGNRNASSISRYSVDSTGALTSLGAVASTTNSPGGVVTSPNGKFLYAASFNGEIDQFSIDVNGGLTHLTPPSVPMLNGDYGLAITPNGKYLYATSSNNVVYQYLVGSDGKLTPNATASVPTATDPVHIAISHDGLHAYVSCYNGNTLQSFNIGPTGVLTANGPDITTNISRPWSIDFSREGGLMYVCSHGTPSIVQFRVMSDGTLTPLSTATIAAPTSAYGVAVSKISNFVFSSSYDSTDTTTKRYGYAIGSGTLTELTPAYDSGATDKWPIVVSPQNILYVCNQTEDTITVLGMDATGGVSLIGTTPTGSEPASIAFVKL